MTISGYGMTGPYRDMPSHGIAYDVWAGIVTPKIDDDGFAYMPEHVSIGINAGPVFGALGLLAGVLRARETGEGCQLEIAQSDAAAAIDWLRSETWKAYERPRVGGHRQRGRQLRAPRAGHRRHGAGVRYQFYATTDGYILFMASEREFWKNFCEGVGRRRAVRDAGPARSTATTPVATPSCRAICATIFATKTTRPSGSSSASSTTRRSRRQHAEDDRGRPAVPRPDAVDPRRSSRRRHAARPIKFVGDELPVRRWRRRVGQHTEEVLRDVLGYDAGRIAKLHDAGALGAKE